MPAAAVVELLQEMESVEQKKVRAQYKLGFCRVTRIVRLIVVVRDRKAEGARHHLDERECQLDVRL